MRRTHTVSTVKELGCSIANYLKSWRNTGIGPENGHAISTVSYSKAPLTGLPRKKGSWTGPEEYI